MQITPSSDEKTRLIQKLLRGEALTTARVAISVPTQYSGGSVLRTSSKDPNSEIFIFS